MSATKLSVLLIALGAQLPSPAVAADSERSEPAPRATRACTPGETWRIPTTFSRRFALEFRFFLSGHFSPVRGLSQALALRRQSEADPEARALSEYWISRAIQKSEQLHSARAGLLQVVLGEVDPRTAGVQIAALECLNRLQDTAPSMSSEGLSDVQLQALLAQAQTDPERETVREAALHLLERHLAQGLGDGVPGSLSGGGIWELTAKLWIAGSAKRSGDVLELSKRWLAAPRVPSALEKQRDPVILMAAHAAYNTRQYARAAELFRSISKSSNLLARSLEGLAWSELQAGRYGQAVGAAVSLRSGGLRRTYAPEAPMIMAMALNELCQYPDSLRAMNQFRSSYQGSWKWLAQWAKGEEKKPQDLYPLALRFLKRDPELGVPVQVASEWIRDPEFLAHQGEINAVFDAQTGGAKMGQQGAQELRRIAVGVAKDWIELRARVREERKRLKPGQSLTQDLRTQLDDLRHRILTYRRIIQAGPVWFAIRASMEARSPALRQGLVARINRDLTHRTRVLHSQLLQIAENNQLIEIEIYNGASQDIIFQNAHPEFKEMSRKLKDQAQKQLAEKVLDWGELPSLDGDGEVWEDELGSFQAKLQDQCQSKEKYLNLQQRSDT